MFRKFLCTGMSMIAAGGNLAPAFAAGKSTTLVDKSTLAFVDVAPSGDYLGAGIESYAVAPRADGGREVIVVAQRGDFAHIQIVPNGDSSFIHGSVFDTGQSVTIEVAGPTVVVHAGGVAIGGWTVGEKGVATEPWGMQDVAANEAFGITLIALGEVQGADSLGAGEEQETEAAIIIPIIIGGALWCIQQCNLCDLYYRTCNPCNNPPRACDHCFAWYCGNV